MGPDTEAVMKDLETDINIPFVLRWNGKELEMIAKTVMRKKNFRTSNKEFPVENAPGTLLHKINWGGQNKPQQPKQNTQQQPKAKPRNRFDKLVNWYKELFDEIRLEENFADGKKKGKSRPGRVKRAGASCDGSVSELRRKAKNSSGEKQKMYHWCANMKSGKKK